ncbi:hypothetical protein MKW94_010795 [Papaver nudicaule]|uniref:BTB domain-containing protein n=1 Tax=Papaver nudicaule TaxID=74823 RepID=A0AA41VCI6_PAPNU|nr:hypothetical protein [Papaver nudicaule]
MPPCSICKKNTVSFTNTSYSSYSQYTQVLDGVVVCNSCRGEVGNLMNLINNKDKSISYPADTNWGKRWIEEMVKERDEGWIGFLGDLAVTFREGIHSDIQVKPGSGLPIPAHKFLLATRSEIFKTMLASDTCKAAPNGSISLPEFNHEELKTFLEFMYRGNLAKEKFEKHFYSLSVAADKYVIPHLQKFCEQQLLNMLNSTNALKVLEISEVCSNETLKLAALDAIIKYKDEIVVLPCFEEFAKQNPHLMVHITRASLTYLSGKRIFCGGSNDDTFES